MLIKIRLKRDADGMILRDDSGAALLLALILLIGIALFLASILTFASTGFLTTQAVRGQGTRTYADDAGVKGAINYLEKHPELGTATGTCPTYTVSDVTGTPVTVTCAPYADSGIITGTSSSSVNTPTYALLTLGSTSTSEDGIRQKNNNILRINGDVFTNNDINTEAGGSLAVMSVVGSVTSRWGCTGIVIAVPPPNCGVTTTEQDDPLYPPLSTSFVARSVGSCGSSTVTLLPGKYTSASELSNCTDTGRTLIFSPGSYYFEFADSGTSSKRKWILKGGVNVIGGTYDPLTGTCTSGVQWIFGGESQIAVSDASLNLCYITPVPDGQRISFYGAGSVARKRPTAATSSGTAPISPTSAAFAIDSSTADASLSSGGNRIATLQTTGFNQNSIPSGADISAAGLRIAHQDLVTTGNLNNLSATVTVVAGDGTSTATVVSGSCSGVPAPCLAGGITKGSGLHEEDPRPDLAQTSTWDNPAPNWGVSKLNGVTVTYSASVPASPSTSVTEKLDGLWLEVTYAPTPLKAATGCLLIRGGGSACSLFSTDSSKTNSISIIGTVYAPASNIDIELNNVSSQVVNRGVIARNLTVAITASSGFLGSPISLPPAGGGVLTDRKVLFTAYVGCSPPTAGCQPKLRAKVRFLTTGTTVIDQWSVLR
jgi:hypothetical protein